MRPVTAKDIAKENDKLRKYVSRYGHPDIKVYMTSGVQESPNLDAILKTVRNYDTFNKGNDPYGEHDMGKFTIDGVDYFWKYDYYDKRLLNGADPYTDEHVTRVLTIMSASEY